MTRIEGSKKPCTVVPSTPHTHCIPCTACPSFFPVRSPVGQTLAEPPQSSKQMLADVISGIGKVRLDKSRFSSFSLDNVRLLLFSLSYIAQTPLSET